MKKQNIHQKWEITQGVILEKQLLFVLFSLFLFGNIFFQQLYNYCRCCHCGQYGREKTGPLAAVGGFLRPTIINLLVGFFLWGPFFWCPQ